MTEEEDAVARAHLAAASGIMENLGQRFVFIDIETTGLNHMTEVVLEMGVRIIDANLDTIDDFDVLIWDTPPYDLRLKQLSEQEDKYVFDMHTKNGLWDACRAEGLEPAHAEEQLFGFLSGHGIHPDEPLCGSSVQFDRAFLMEQYPAVHNLFSYRNIDTSTVKELCRRFNPPIYEALNKYVIPKKLHRVLPDLTDTIDELGFYRDNFLWTVETP